MSSPTAPPPVPPVSLTSRITAREGLTGISKEMRESALLLGMLLAVLALVAGAASVLLLLG